MSVHVSSDVWKHSRARGPAFTVIISLADQANDDGECFGSVEYIAKRCRVSVRSCHRYLDQLEALGELRREQRPGRSSRFVVTTLGSSNAGSSARDKTSANLADLSGDDEARVTSVNLAGVTAKLTDGSVNLAEVERGAPLPLLAEGSATVGRQNHHLTGQAEEQELSSSPTADAAADQDTDEPSPAAAKAAEEPQRDDVDRLCAHLADRIEANGSKRPTITVEWRRQCRLLLDRDHRTEAQVRAAIDWCQNDSFWMANIRSMPKLREQYDTLRLRAVEQSQQHVRSQANQRQNRTNQVFDAAMERARARDAATQPQPQGALTS